jgi:hypothetical protein
MMSRSFWSEGEVADLRKTSKVSGVEVTQVSAILPCARSTRRPRPKEQEDDAPA